MTMLLLACLFTLLIHASETAAYAVRLAGIRIGKLAVALSLAGMIVLVSRTSNMFQGMLTAGIADNAGLTDPHLALAPFRYVLISSSVGTAIAILLFPTLVALSARMIAHFEVTGSIPLMLKATANIHSVKRAKRHIRLPRLEMLSRLRVGGVPKRLIVLNVAVTAIYTVGVLAALYASAFTPDGKSQATMSSALINGIATIIMTLFLDPRVALLTDRAMSGKASQESMNKMFGLLMLSRLAGTILAQVLLVPAAAFIRWTLSLY
ncbi:DUF2837 family protein [Paenibacillus sp. N10]|uniref:Lipid II flippase Amj n=2 Tax=Paenibacillus lutrae TaxID=2078573 RepID=A0A7X3FFZ6_9BACL|nr:lipid II flippase Amj family protein [Paenibacillus lutrae]MVO98930.1 DUF2837 family protein [Paenibacillus lutrae]